MGDEGLLTDPQSLENAIGSTDSQGTSLETTVQNAITTAVAAGLRTCNVNLSGYPGPDVMQMRTALTQNNYTLSQSGSTLTINW